jgi:hypothetical protein
MRDCRVVDCFRAHGAIDDASGCNVQTLRLRIADKCTYSSQNLPNWHPARVATGDVLYGDVDLIGLIIAMLGLIG